METSERQAASWAITGVRHGGITLSTMDSLDPDGYVFEFHERPPHVTA